MNHKAKHYLVVFFKYALFWACLYVIYIYLLEFDINFSFLMLFLASKSFTELILILTLLITLSYSNWFFEALKWSKLVNTIQPTSLKLSLRISLIGHALSIITPAKVGDFMAKVYAHNNTKYIIFLNFFHQYAQLLVTLIVGGFFILYFAELKWFFTQIQLPNYLLYLIFSFGFISLIVAYWLKRKLFFSISNWLKNNFKIAFEVQIYSFFKYFSFSLQYLFLLLLFDVGINFFILYGTISIVYLLSSLIPTNFIADVGVKTTWGLILFGHFGIDAGIVVFVSFGMWVLNFAIPGILGSLLILKSKLKLSTSVNHNQWSSFL